MEDVLRVRGKLISPRIPASSSKQHSQSAGDAKATFLSKWEAETGKGGVIKHLRIHHFCTAPIYPRLPPSLQVLSKYGHLKPIDITSGVLDEESELTIESESISDKKEDKMSDKEPLSQYETLPVNSKKSTSHRSSTPATASSVFTAEVESMSLINTAKEKLRKIQGEPYQEGAPSSSSLKRVKDRSVLQSQKKLKEKSKGVVHESKSKVEVVGSKSSQSAKVTRVELTTQLGSSRDMCLTGTQKDIMQDHSR